MDLYAGLLSSTPLLPADVLRAAYAFARRTNDIDLLTTIASRGDLPADVSRGLATMRDAKVVATFRARPTLPAANEARTVETRAGVLAKAIGRYGQPDPAAFEDGLNQFMVKPTAALLSVLWQRPANWYTPEQAAALLLALDAANNRDDIDNQRKLAARLGREVSAKLLPQLRNDFAILSVLRHDVPVEPAIQAVKNAIVADSTADRASWAIRPLQLVVDVALEAFADDERQQLISELVEFVEGYPKARLLVNSAAAKRAKRVQPKQPWDLSPACPPRVATGFAGADEGTLKAGAASNDPDVLAEVARALVAKTREEFKVEAVKLALRNTAMRPEDRHHLVESLKHIPRGSYIIETLEQLDVVGLHSSDKRTVELWCELFPQNVLARHGWAPYGGQDHAVDQIHDWLLAPRSFGTWQLLKEAWLAGLRDVDLLNLSMKAIRELLHEWPKEENLAADRLGTLLAERLGGNIEAWATFDALAPEFTGTLAELLVTAELASA